tara:strand:+ start:1070 stop:1228 length:159 start_codon:yes stop_codon:yes gene_type:complete
MKGMAFALRAERKKTKMLEDEVRRLRKAIIEVAFDKHESVYEMKQALVKVIE